MQPKKERDTQIKISSLSQVLMQIGKNNIFVPFPIWVEQVTTETQGLPNVWTEGSVVLRRNFKQCTYLSPPPTPNLHFLARILKKVKIPGAGEGMVKQTHSYMADGKGKPI